MGCLQLLPHADQQLSLRQALASNTRGQLRPDHNPEASSSRPHVDHRLSAPRYYHQLGVSPGTKYHFLVSLGEFTRSLLSRRRRQDMHMCSILAGFCGYDELNALVSTPPFSLLVCNWNEGT